MDLSSQNSPVNMMDPPILKLPKLRNIGLGIERAGFQVKQNIYYAEWSIVEVWSYLFRYKYIILIFFVFQVGLFFP